jgi:hypothetical protein
VARPSTGSEQRVERQGIAFVSIVDNRLLFSEARPPRASMRPSGWFGLALFPATRDHRPLKKGWLLTRGLNELQDPPKARHDPHVQPGTTVLRPARAISLIASS